MLAHLPNRFNSLTRGHVRATSTPPENHYNGAKLFALARFAFARWRVCTSPRRPRRLARRSLCRCYDCRCVYAQLLHALGARICIYIYIGDRVSQRFCTLETVASPHPFLPFITPNFRKLASATTTTTTTA